MIGSIMRTKSRGGYQPNIAEIPGRRQNIRSLTGIILGMQPSIPSGVCHTKNTWYNWGIIPKRYYSLV